MKTINLGNQIWTAKNFNAITFLNGDSIPVATTPEEFKELTSNKKACLAFFNFDERNIDYGCCYNWFAINDKRGLIPIGYNIPSKNDAKILLDNFIGSYRNDYEVRLDKTLQEKLLLLNQSFSNSLKDKITWEERCSKDVNSEELNFNAEALGSISPSSKYNFGWIGVAFSIWLSDKDSKYRWSLVIQENKISINGIPYKDGDLGHFIRLIKLDDAYKEDETTIGTKVWMKKNLNVDTFQNGDRILEVTSDEEWQNAIDNEKPAYRHIKDNPKNDSEFGKIYNSYAVRDERGLGPIGWRIPTIEDINITLDSLKIKDFDYGKHFSSEKSVYHNLNDKLLSTESGGTNNSNLYLDHYPQLTGFKGFTSKSDVGKMWLNVVDWEKSHFYEYTKSSFIPQRFSKESRELMNGYVIRCVKD